MSNKDLLSELVLQCFDGTKLNEEKVFMIAGKLSRQHLRVFVKLLKRYLAINTVVIETAHPVSESIKKGFDEKYEGKIIEYVVNKELIVGTKIYENDIIYSRNLKDKLLDIEKYITI